MLGVGPRRHDDRRRVPRRDARGARRRRTRCTASTTSCGTSSASGCTFVSADLDECRRLRDRRQAARRHREGASAQEECNRLFYLAVPPSVFEPIVTQSLEERARAAQPHGRRAAVGARRHREAVRPQPRERAAAERSRARIVRRASDLSHRSLSRKGDGSERPRAALRELDLRAALEPAVDSPRADHGGGERRRRGARQVLRGSGRRSRHVPEPPAAAAEPHGDGAAAAACRRTPCATRR